MNYVVGQDGYGVGRQEGQDLDGWGRVRVFVLGGLLWGGLFSCIDLIEQRSKLNFFGYLFWNFFLRQVFNYKLNLFGRYRNILNFC